MNSRKCCVCMCDANATSTFISVLENYEDTQPLENLRKCVAFIEWSEEFHICLNCVEQLTSVSKFVDLCWKSSEERERLKNINDTKQDTKDEISKSEIDSTYYTVGYYPDQDEAVEFNKQDVLMCGDQSGATDQNVKPNTHPELLNPDPESDDAPFHSSEDENKATEVTKPKKGKRTVCFACDICGNTFTTSTKLRNHAFKEHNIDKKAVKPFSCPKCPNKFSRSSNLSQHMKYHDGSRTHTCTYCGKGFITKSDLIIHEKQHLNKREYICIICSKNFNTHKDLRSHNWVVHTDPGLWPHVCSFCDKRFPIKSNYDTHMRRHTNEKPFACLICSKRFNDKCVMQKHMRSHSNVRAYKCSECQREYKDKKVMELHMAKIHKIGNAKIPEHVKKHFCHICPKSYFAKSKLTRHLYSHYGEKPFDCSICSKKFADKSYVKQHMKNAHNLEVVSENKE